MAEIFHSAGVSVVYADDRLLIELSRTAGDYLAIVLAAAEQDRGEFPDSPGWTELAALRDALDMMLIGKAPSGVRQKAVRRRTHPLAGTAVAGSVSAYFWATQRCCEEKR